MDKFRVEFKCIKEPKSNDKLEGFKENRRYTGRCFNGLYEIAPSWGSGEPTRVIDNKLFEEYFEVLN